MKKKILIIAGCVLGGFALIGLIASIVEGGADETLVNTEETTSIVSSNAETGEHIVIGNLNQINPRDSKLSNVSITLTKSHNIKWVPRDLENQFVIGVPTVDNRSIFYIETGTEHIKRLRSVFNNAIEWANTAKQNNVNEMSRRIPTDELVWAYGFIANFEPMVVLPIFTVVDGKCYLHLFFQTTHQYNSGTVSGTQTIFPDSEIVKILQIISEENIKQASGRVRDLSSLFN